MDYDKWVDETRKIADDFKNSKISLNKRAQRLNEVEPQFYGYADKINKSDFFSVDDLYIDDFRNPLIIKLVLIHNIKDKESFDSLLENVVHYVKDKKEIDNTIYYKFKFIVSRDDLLKALENKRGIKEIFDFKTSYYNSMNIPRFQFTINLTPLKEIFGKSSSSKLAFSKLNHGLYLAINNGCQFYEIHRFHNEDGKIRPRYHKDIKEVFRSSWESNLARLLNYKNIEWEYEKEGFPLNSDYLIKTYNYNTYIPDFFLKKNTILEVKGVWDEHSLLQVNLFKEQYPENQLLLIDGDMMYSLNNLYKDIIPNWEKMKIKASQRNIPLVGINRKERKKYVENLKVGDIIFLERESENPYDQNAIKVLNSDGYLLGYIAKQWAFVYSQKIDLGMQFEATVSKKQEKVILLDIKRTNLYENICHALLK